MSRRDVLDAVRRKRAILKLGQLAGRSKMTQRTLTTLTLLVLAAFLSASQSTAAAQQPKITVLYDAFGQVGGLQKDWCYSALVEASGKRILFDTGDDPDILAANAKALGVDLSRLDFVVMSHRHGDRLGGMAYLLKVNPNV